MDRGVSWAMHETDHRFTVSGYVYDKQGKPIEDARVHVRDLRDQKIETVTTYTDGTGYYKAVLHLHNDNEGDTVQVTASKEKLGSEEVKTVRAQFNASDRTTERRAAVNIGAVPDAIAGGTSPKGFAGWPYVAGGVLVGGAVAAIVWSRHRKIKARAKRRGKKRP